MKSALASAIVVGEVPTLILVNPVVSSNPAEPSVVSRNLELRDNGFEVRSVLPSPTDAVVLGIV